MKGKPIDSKRLRGIAHHLDPIVTVGDRGPTEPVARELDRALTDHELVKVRMNVGDRTLRKDIGDALAAAANASIVQRIGKVIVLYRENPDAKPNLSNVQRFAG